MAASALATTLFIALLIYIGENRKNKGFSFAGSLIQEPNTFGEVLKSFLKALDIRQHLKRWKNPPIYP
jgi:hypothetical protein